MRIAIDMDEVITEFLEMYLKFHRKTFNETWKKSQFFSYNYWEVFGNKKEIDVARHNQFYKSDYFDRIKPIEGAIDGINKLAKTNQIYFITARPKLWKKKTEKWLKKYFKNLNYKIIYLALVHFDGQAGKGEICKKFNIDIILEDRIEYALDCAKEDISVIFFDKPWNQNFNNHDGIIKVKNWPEALSQIEVLSKS